MAKNGAVVLRSPKIVNEDDTLREMPVADRYAPLAEWVMARVNAWVQWRDSEYAAKWDSWERLARGIFHENERLRASERATVVTPALSEAVENAAAELEEAVFGRGQDYFDIEAPEDYDEPQEQAAPGPDLAVGAPPMGGMAPPMGGEAQPTGGEAQPTGGMAAPMGGEAQPMGGMAAPMGGGVPADPFAGLSPRPDPAMQLDKLRAKLKADLAATDFAVEAVKAILYGAIFGSGIGEITVEEVVRRQPMTAEGGRVVAKTTKYTCARLRAVNPRNFAYDPNADRLENGLGCAIVERVSKHLILQAQKDGVFRAGVDLFESGSADGLDVPHGDAIDAASDYDQFSAKQVRYYGLVPKSLLDYATGKADAAPREAVTDFVDPDNDELVEAFVVIINDRNVAKAVRNPYSAQDRPIVCFPWDIVPGRLMGRGICEKGAAVQKILDAETRARLDSLALVTAPMMGLDASRLPRGFEFKIRPGGSILTNGKPSEVMEPFKFGQLDPNHWQNAAELKAMVQQATGSVDGAAIAQSASDARSGAMSMAMAPIIKRYKRTLIHFLDGFMMPALEKIIWRNMQFASDRYPVVPFKLRAASTMGIMQREYETQQMTMLLSNLPPGTPEHRAVLLGVVANTSIPNRERIMELIDSAEERAKLEAAAISQAQNDPMLQQAKSVSLSLDIARKEAEIAELRAKTAKLIAEANEIRQTAEIEAVKVATKGIYSLPEEEQKNEFDRRLAIMEQMLEAEKVNVAKAQVIEKARDRESNERITDKQIQASLLAAAMKGRERGASKPVDAGTNPSL